MQLDDLKTLYRQELEQDMHTIDFSLIRSEVAKYNRQSTWGWMIELIACAAIILFNLVWWLIADAPNLLMQTGMAAMILCALFVGYTIIRKRRLTADTSWTLKSKLAREIEKLEKEARLHLSVLWWYLTPITIAVLLASYGGYAQRTGTYVPDTGLWIYWGLCAVLFFGIYWFNRRLVRMRINPMLERLRQLQKQLDTAED